MFTKKKKRKFFFFLKLLKMKISNFQVGFNDELEKFHLSTRYEVTTSCQKQHRLQKESRISCNNTNVNIYYNGNT